MTDSSKFSQKRIVLLLLILGIGFPIQAQKFLVLRNGSKIEFSEFVKTSPEVILIKTKEGKKHYKVQDVECFYDLTYVPTIPIRYSQFESVHYFSVIKGELYMSPAKLLEGKINLYRTVYMRNGAYASYQIDKEGKVETMESELELVILDFTNGKGRLRKQLGEYMADQPALLDMLLSDDFKFSEESIIDLIKEYNTRTFEKNGQGNAKMSSVFFYSKMKNSVQEDLQLTVNDSLEFVLPTRRLISVKVAIDALSKICVRSTSGSDCLVLSGSPYYIRYYEVDYNQRKQKIEIKPVHSVDAQKYIQSINKKPD